MNGSVRQGLLPSGESKPRRRRTAGSAADMKKQLLEVITSLSQQRGELAKQVATSSGEKKFQALYEEAEGDVRGLREENARLRSVATVGWQSELAIPPPLHASDLVNDNQGERTMDHASNATMWRSDPARRLNERERTGPIGAA